MISKNIDDVELKIADVFDITSTVKPKLKIIILKSNKINGQKPEIR